VPGGLRAIGRAPLSFDNCAMGAFSLRPPHTRLFHNHTVIGGTPPIRLAFYAAACEEFTSVLHACLRITRACGTRHHKPEPELIDLCAPRITNDAA
jgi:hypothetical protein